MSPEIQLSLDFGPETDPIPRADPRTAEGSGRTRLVSLVVSGNPGYHGSRHRDRFGNILVTTPPFRGGYQVTRFVAAVTIIPVPRPLPGKASRAHYHV